MKTILVVTMVLFISACGKESAPQGSPVGGAQIKCSTQVPPIVEIPCAFPVPVSTAR